MHTLVVDDERGALEILKDAVSQCFPDTPVYAFQFPDTALKFVREFAAVRGQRIDFAFLDVEMAGMSGLELASALKEICPNIFIFFVTAHKSYAYDAYRSHATGYLLKPVTAELIEAELAEVQKLYVTPLLTDKKRVKIHTFGTFDVAVDQAPLTFSRSRAKELLAYLVDRQGSGVSISDICSVFFEDDLITKKQKKYVQNYIFSLREALREVGIEDILIKKWNYLALDVEKVDCDYYNLLKGDMDAINAFSGQYMSNYSWAEVTMAELNKKFGQQVITKEKMQKA